ncbi:valine--tRNA ligase-like [Scylla paramamosain]|uniref:valine--tRNA ligase-like n=1 Tax=Scylla paramamosain TaxID=85552 RepID=UPI003082C541
MTKGAMDLYMSEVARGVARGRLAACATREMCMNIKKGACQERFVRCKELAQEVSEAVQSGRLNLVPQLHRRAWHSWLDNITDWCVSQQLWWGHRMPVYHITAADGREVWVAAARRKMQGGRLCRRKTVLLHGLLCDGGGHKTSKSWGNVINPLDVISGASLEVLCERMEGSLNTEEVLTGIRRNFPTGIPECGADALWFTLCSTNFNTAHPVLQPQGTHLSFSSHRCLASLQHHHHHHHCCHHLRGGETVMWLRVARFGGLQRAAQSEACGIEGQLLIIKLME